ncbi:MAG: PHP domain-containing protein [Acidaminococcaceae bacterium]|nr:PHP domain-containing protein [Acidaminococcaceae bacterium]
MEANDLVDLHIHSTASDGTWTPTELVAAAKQRGLKLIAVTDHDQVSNVAETRKIAKDNGLNFINGVEVCSSKEGLQFHILGYGINENNKILCELIAHNDELLRDTDVDSIKVLEKEGWPVSVREFANYTYDRRRGGWAALAYLIDKKLCTGVNDFFQNIFTKERELTFPTFASVTEVVTAIHDAGGIAVCAHAASGFHTKDVRQNLKILKNEKLDGFECYHSGHTVTDTDLLLRYCTEHDLYISAGSDCHGTFVPGRRIGVPQVTFQQIRLPEGLIL